MLKTDWSLSWTPETAEAIVKALVAVGVPVFEETVGDPKKSQGYYNLIAESCGEACGTKKLRSNHFNHLEYFLAWYFSPTVKTEMEALGEKIKELQEQYNKLKEAK